MNYNNEELVSGIRDGSEELFCFLYEKYFFTLNRFSFHIVMREESKDIVHDVFSKLWETRKSLPSEINIKAYLYTSVKNRSLDYLKHQGVEDKNKKKLLEAILFVEDDWIDDDVLLYDKLMTCIKGLPDQQLNVVRLRIDGKSYKEISEELNISVKTVNNHITKIYTFIRDNIKFGSLILIYFRLFF